MPGRLSLYRFAADAWEGGLRAWCEKAPGYKGESRLLLANRGQRRWLLRELAKLGDAAARVQILDPEELAAAPGGDARLCCVGWAAGRGPELELLDAAAGKCAAVEIYSPMPRLPADAMQREWIERVEERLDLERTACEAGGFASANEGLVARLERSDRAAPAPAPALLVGREWRDQVELVCGQVLEWTRGSLEGPVGIVGPGDSVTAMAVAERLRKAGVAVESAGRKREPAAELLIVEAAARYLLNGQDVDEFLELARLLWLHAREEWGAFEPERVQEAVERAFRQAQSRNMRILAQADLRHGLWPRVRELVEALGRWDGPAERWWERFCDGLKLPRERVERLLGAEPAGGLEWLIERIAVRRAERAAPDFAAGARVAVTGFDDAAQQPWERLILLDCQENGWGPRDEAAAGMARVIEQARLLDLLEQTRQPVLFAGMLRNEAGAHLEPNEWVLRALLETAGPGGMQRALGAWKEAARPCAGLGPARLDPAEEDHLKRVTASRHSATAPFDSYLFNYSGSKIEPGAWPVTDLQRALATPATFALKLLFGAEQRAGGTFERQEHLAVGTLAHAWLGRIVRAGDGFARPGEASEDAAKLERERAAARRAREAWYEAEGLALPLWWETALKKTAWAVRRCLREVRARMDGGYCAAEQSLAASVKTPLGMVPLKGRMDLVVSDQPRWQGARVSIFDFKTGDAKAADKLDGEGAQFAAYCLMALAAGAAEARASIIQPEERAREIFGPEHEPEMRGFFARFAELRQTLRFGRRGPLVDEYGLCERLPLATVPIDEAVLERKGELFLLA